MTGIAGAPFTMSAPTRRERISRQLAMCLKLLTKNAFESGDAVAELSELSENAN
jgi:hypothetical protein